MATENSKPLILCLEGIWEIWIRELLYHTKEEELLWIEIQKNVHFYTIFQDKKIDISKDPIGNCFLTTSFGRGFKTVKGSLVNDLFALIKQNQNRKNPLSPSKEATEKLTAAQRVRETLRKIKI